MRDKSVIFLSHRIKNYCCPHIYTHLSTHLSIHPSMLCILQVPWFAVHHAISSQLSQLLLVVEKVHLELRK
jgi:hypothetical protein